MIETEERTESNHVVLPVPALTLVSNYLYNRGADKGMVLSRKEALGYLREEYPTWKPEEYTLGADVLIAALDTNEYTGQYSTVYCPASAGYCKEQVERDRNL